MDKFKNYNLEKKYDILIYGTRCYRQKLDKTYADQYYAKKYIYHYI